jgi:hypothetical protein
MLPTTFFTCFWLTLIGMMGMLGLTGAILAGAALRSGELGAGMTATVLTLACGLVCGIAQDAWRTRHHQP